jgi:hypothetical protein
MNPQIKNMAAGTHSGNPHDRSCGRMKWRVTYLSGNGMRQEYFTSRDRARSFVKGLIK